MHYDGKFDAGCFGRKMDERGIAKMAFIGMRGYLIDEER